MSDDSQGAEDKERLDRLEREILESRKKALLQFFDTNRYASKVLGDDPEDAKRLVAGSAFFLLLMLDRPPGEMAAAHRLMMDLSSPSQRGPKLPDREWSVRAVTAAGLKQMMKCGLPRDAVADQLADLLKRFGFPNPRGRAGVIQWANELSSKSKRGEFVPAAAGGDYDLMRQEFGKLHGSTAPAFIMRFLEEHLDYNGYRP